MGIKKISFSMQLDDNSKYFDELPKGTQKLVRELILEAAQNRNGPEGYKLDDEAIEAIECHSRGGFIPHSFNKGGLEYRNFTDLMQYFGGGYIVAHKGAAKEIQRQIDLGFENVSEALKSEMGEKYKYYFGSKPCTNTLTYHNLEDLRVSLEKQNQTESAKYIASLVSRIQDLEHYYLSDEENTIMHSIQFMYHGTIDGVHYASVSAAVNTEGPYHRSHISWAPNVFCEGAKEIEIAWTTQAELKKKLKAALNKVSEAVF